MLLYNGFRIHQGKSDARGLESGADYSRWSFGGNRLQLKAESRLIGDVASALTAVATLGNGKPQSLQALTRKQDLLQLLLENEQMRLVVWLFPLDHERRHVFSTGHSAKPAEVSTAFQVQSKTDDELGAAQLSFKYRLGRRPCSSHTLDSAISIIET